MAASERWKRGLVIYYGVWQALHLAFNAFAFAFDWALARSLLGAGMTDAQFDAVKASGVIDLFVAHPTAFVFVYGYLRRARWAEPVGIASLTIAAYSAYLVTYLQLTSETWRFDPLSFAFAWVPFVPALVLLGVLLTSPSAAKRYDL